MSCMDTKPRCSLHAFSFFLSLIFVELATGAHCIDCKQVFPTAFVREAVMRGDGSPCICPTCGGLVKPSIVFFGESLPERFWLVT